MNGSVYKRCPCGEKARQSCKKEHRSWYFAHDVPTLPGDLRRPRVRRGGFASKTDAQEALIASMNRHRQTGMAAEQRLEGRRKFLADYLPEWLAGRTKLKPLHAAVVRAAHLALSGAEAGPSPAGGPQHHRYRGDV